MKTITFEQLELEERLSADLRGATDAVRFLVASNGVAACAVGVRRVLLKLLVYFATAAVAIKMDGGVLLVIEEDETSLVRCH